VVMAPNMNRGTRRYLISLIMVKDVEK